MRITDLHGSGAGAEGGPGDVSAGQVHVSQVLAHTAVHSVSVGLETRPESQQQNPDQLHIRLNCLSCFLPKNLAGTMIGNMRVRSGSETLK
jgi:hypothetical protein